jgi:hypothetical protein
MPSLDVTLMREVARSRFAATPLPKGVSRDPYYAYFDAMASALRQAIDMWRVQAVISDVKIMGPTAFGGRISLPALDGLIRGFAPAGPWDAYSRAIAAGVHNQFRLMCSLAMFPGLPLYPAFAAFPAPMAPPMPNLPTPLLTFVLPGLAQVETTPLRDEIIRKYPTPKPVCADAVAGAIAEGFAKAVHLWLGQQQITLLLGTGPIPTFAPPYVPVGPVVNGWVLARAGSIAA